jgi:hypothetical protein
MFMDASRLPRVQSSRTVIDRAASDAKLIDRRTILLQSRAIEDVTCSWGKTDKVKTAPRTRSQSNDQILKSRVRISFVKPISCRIYCPLLFRWPLKRRFLGCCYKRCKITSELGCGCRYTSKVTETKTILLQRSDRWWRVFARIYSFRFFFLRRLKCQYNFLAEAQPLRGQPPRCDAPELTPRLNIKSKTNIF